MMQNVPPTREHLNCSGPPGGAVAIIASAGGIPALISLLRSLPKTFPLPIFVAQHLPRQPSKLDAVLSWHSQLNVVWAVEGDQPRKGNIYLVPPGTNLAITDAGFEISPLAPGSSSWLGCGDHLIDSLVARYGASTIGIVLSGALPAGVKGLRAIKACGGYTMAQDRQSSTSFEMPAAAIDFAKAEIVMPPDRMALALSIIAEPWQEQQHPIHA
ncbi:MAG TPA: chemotaxis protein CheB [Reyranella sp.]|jgi:two-component system chemotaxis response regulator CheB|nr:chemotaxis protein CheB [Reyranella sp.]